MDEQIAENMVMASRIGMKYASRNNRHPDEAIAEAYFHLVMFFTEDIRLYHANSEDYKRILGSYIKRAVMKYFERSNRQMNTLLVDKIVRNTDEEMIEFLSGLVTDDQAFQVFHYLRNGINLMEVEMVDPLLKKIVKKLRLQVAGRIRRLEELRRAGIKTSREVKYDRSLEDECNEDSETGCAA